MNKSKFVTIKIPKTIVHHEPFGHNALILFRHNKGGGASLGACVAVSHSMVKYGKVPTIAVVEKLPEQNGIEYYDVLLNNNYRYSFEIAKE